MAKPAITLDENNAKLEKTKKLIKNFRRPDVNTQLLYDRMRLAIVTSLSIQPYIKFTDLARSLAATDGNLSAHAKKLEQAGLITINKRFKDRKPCTEFSITSNGRDTLNKYLDHMESIIQTTR